MPVHRSIAIALGLLALPPLLLWPGSVLAQASSLTRAEIRLTPEQAFLQGCQRAFGRDTGLARPYCRCYLESFRQRYPVEQFSRIGRLVNQLGRNGQVLVGLMLEPEREFCRRLVQPD